MSRYSREAQVGTIAAGNRRTFTVQADWFFIHRLQANTEAGADVEILLSVNGRSQAPVSPGEPGTAVNAGEGEIKALEFENTTGAPVFVRIIYGIGGRPYSPTYKFSGGAIDITPASVLAIAQAILNAAGGTALVPVCMTVTADTVLHLYKAFEVFNAGPSAVAIDFPGGTFNLPAGESKDFSCENDQDWIGDITVHALPNDGPPVTTGCPCEITGLKYP